jgi:hypothetical protein
MKSPERLTTENSSSFIKPLSVISNESLFPYLIQKESYTSFNDSTVFVSVFQNSHDVILC